ncbi:transposase [Actinacidiphila glaucinigra]|uniref:transposase n=1 Tax=Actinacidiphila glaucinigra TaxID=235986 RepID=UPI00386510BF
MALDDELDETDALIERRFRDHPYVEIILSMPGLGPVLGAEFIAHTGGGMNVFGSPDRLAGVAGLAWHPSPKTPDGSAATCADPAATAAA